MTVLIVILSLLAVLHQSHSQSNNYLGEGKDATIYRYEFDNFNEDGYRFAWVNFYYSNFNLINGAKWLINC